MFSQYTQIKPSEATRYNEVTDNWSVNTGHRGESNPLRDQAVKAGIIGLGGLAVWKFGPDGIEKLKDVSGRGAPIVASNNVDYWYKFARRAENLDPSNPLASHFSSIWNVFSRAGYVSETLSPFTDRGTSTLFMNISDAAIGVRARDASLTWINQQLGVDPNLFAGLDYLAFEQGKLYAASESGGKLVRGTHLADNVRLMDKGRVWLAHASSRMEEAGLRDIDDELKIVGERMFGGSFAPIRAEFGESIVIPGKGPVRFNNQAAAFGDHMTMAVQRTALLLDEMFTQGSDVLSLFVEEPHKKIKDVFTRLGIDPHYNLGHSSTMIGRYTGTALKAFGAYAVLNQANAWMQSDNGVERTAGALAQFGALSFIGNRLGNVFGKSELGTYLGAGAATLGFLGIGPFKHGPLGGFAESVGNLNLMRSYIGEYTGINYVKRKIEETMPGATGGGAAVAMGIIGGVGYNATRRFLDQRESLTRDARRDLLLAYDFDNLGELKQRLASNTMTSDVSRHGRVMSIVQKRPTSMAELTEELDYFFASIEKSGKLEAMQNQYGRAGDTQRMRAGQLADALSIRDWERTRKEILNSKLSVGQKLNKIIDASSFVKGSLLAGAVGAVGWAAITGGLGTLETPDEIRDLNQGKKLEEVRRGQLWEFGVGRYEGADTLFYRPTWIARMKGAGQQAGSTGNRGAIEEFFLKNFSYELEKEAYWDRPSPVTSAAFDQIPFVYGLIKPMADLVKRAKLSHVDEWTRTDEQGNIEFLERDTGEGSLPNMEMGGIGMAAPYSPYSPGRVWGRTWNEMTTVMGLQGFYKRTVKDMVTGAEGFYDQREQLESFSENVDLISKFYERHTGGSFAGIPMTSELIRRFLIKADVKNYNPIENQMPDWLPGAMHYGNPYTDARYGEGEYRMPGAGYAKQHGMENIPLEEYGLLHRLNILGDVSPWSIEYKETEEFIQQNLSNYSEKDQQWFHRYKKMIREKRDKQYVDSRVFNKNQYTDVNGRIAEVNPERLSFKIEGSNTEYGLAGLSQNSDDLIGDLNLSIHEAAAARKRNAEIFADKVKVGKTVSMTTPRALSAAVNEQGQVSAAINVGGTNLNAYMKKKGQFATTEDNIGKYSMMGGFRQGIGSMWEKFTHDTTSLVQPIEHVTTFGFAPMSKFIGKRDILAEYQQMHMYGEDIKMWQKPFDHWIMPSVRSAMNKLGIDYVNSDIKELREIEEYFDKVKYMKYRSMYEEARNQKVGTSMDYAKEVRSTILGSSGFESEQTFSRKMGGIESRYAIGFSRETDPERREEILKALPEYKRRLMMGQWNKGEMDALQRMANTGSITEEQLGRLGNLFQQKVDSGYSRTTEQELKYMEDRGEEDTYANYMRREELGQYFAKNAPPNPDWIGYNPAVDLEDIKMKYIEQEGLDYHDAGMYQSRAQVLHRKPYIDQRAIEQINIGGSNLDRSNSAMRRLAGAMNGHHTDVRYNVNSPYRQSSHMTISVRQNHPYMPSDY